MGSQVTWRCGTVTSFYMPGVQTPFRLPYAWSFGFSKLTLQSISPFISELEHNEAANMEVIAW